MTSHPTPSSCNDAEHAAWLADKIGALGDYAKEAAAMLRRWPASAASPSQAQSEPLNGIPATWAHDEGAYAQCGDCGRYSADPNVMRGVSPVCECGSHTGWSGSFKKPGPDAKWSAGIQSPPAPSQEQSVPQPVAWMTKSGFYPSHDCIPARDFPPLGNPVPLYTAIAAGIQSPAAPASRQKVCDRCFGEGSAQAGQVCRKCDGAGTVPAHVPGGTAAPVGGEVKAPRVLNALQVLKRTGYRPGDLAAVENFLAVLWGCGMWVIENPLAAGVLEAQPQPSESESRFFMDHGMWHDRVTCQHLYTQDQYDAIQRQLLEAQRTADNLARALRREIEPPTFMGEPITLPDDEAFLQHQRDRIEAAKKHDAEQAKPKLASGPAQPQGTAAPVGREAKWICPRCKVDRFKEACPGPHIACPMKADAQVEAAPVGGEAGTQAWQGGLSNDELRAALRAKLPKVEPTDRDLTMFALGVEVGVAKDRIEWEEYQLEGIGMVRRRKSSAASVLEAQPQPTDQGEK